MRWEVAVAKQINPDPDEVEHTLASFRKLPDFDKLGLPPTEAARKKYQEGRTDGYVIGFFQGWTAAVVERHGAECEDDDCWLCHRLSRALSVLTAYEIENPPSPKSLGEGRPFRVEE